VSGPGKVIKIWLKHFSAVLTGVDKNCTPNTVGMFQMQNGVIRARFSTLPTLGLFWGGVWTWKSHQNSPETCFIHTEGKQLELHLKHYGYVSGAKSSHLCPISTFPALLLSIPAKVVKIRLKSVLSRTDRNCTHTLWECSWCKTESFEPDFLLRLVQTCSGGIRTRKSHQNSTETFFSRTDGKR